MELVQIDLSCWHQQLIPVSYSNLESNYTVIKAPPKIDHLLLAFFSIFIPPSDSNKKTPYRKKFHPQPHIQDLRHANTTAHSRKSKGLTNIET